MAMHNTSILLSNKDRHRAYIPVKNTVLLGSEQYLGFSVAGSNLGLFIAESPLTIFTSFCNKNTQNEFFWEMYCLTGHLIYMEVMWHKINWWKIHQGDDKLNFFQMMVNQYFLMEPSSTTIFVISFNRKVSSKRCQDAGSYRYLIPIGAERMMFSSVGFSPDANGWWHHRGNYNH